MDAQRYVHSWSGGKDSTASIILDHIHNNPPLAQTVVFAEVMFDLERGISGEPPEHIEWINTIAIPRLESWGFEVVKARAKWDYVSFFMHTVTKSKKPGRNGKAQGFPLGGGCWVNSKIKMRAIREANRIAKTKNAIQIIGYAIDEPNRLGKMRERGGQISLLEQYGYTEAMAFQLCKDWGLLSPTYEAKFRSGCWFCPNASISELAYLKEARPDLWAELEKLSHVPNTVARGFKWGESFASVNRRVDQYLRAKELREGQLRLDV